MENKESKNMIPMKQGYEANQLNLFQDFLCNTNAERETLSNTIELWDAVPKYFINRRRQGKIRKDGYLPIASRDFVFKGQNLIVKIKPARIIIDGIEKEFYPSAREELVEDALRKLACKPGNGYLDTNRSGVSFTLYELRRELKKRGHTPSYYQVVESLDILSGSIIEIRPLNDKALYKTAPITSLLGVSKEDLKNDPKSRWHADFSALVTEGIKRIKYRQYNYGLMMILKGQLARYLHKRLAHNYVQASLLHPYRITMRGIERDSGLLCCRRANDNRRKLEEALEELRKNGVLMRFKTEEVRRGKNKSIEDIKYSLHPSHEFTSDAKRANKKVSLALDR